MKWDKCLFCTLCPLAFRIIVQSETSGETSSPLVCGVGPAVSAHVVLSRTLAIRFAVLLLWLVGIRVRWLQILFVLTLVIQKEFSLLEPGASLARISIHFLPAPGRRISPKENWFLLVGNDI